jgi:predicted ester cyclase
MNSEANKTVVKRYMQMWNTGNVVLADEAHPEVRDPESVKQAVRKMRAAFPDFRITIESMVSEGDLVALRGTVRTEIVSRVMWFVRLIDGKMEEMWTGPETPR